MALFITPIQKLGSFSGGEFDVSQSCDGCGKPLHEEKEVQAIRVDVWEAGQSRAETWYLCGDCAKDF
jgi:hypothetical protein